MRISGIKGVFEMLGGGRGAGAETWNEILAFTDRFQLTLHLRGTPGLPEWFEAEIETRLAKNLKRRERLREAYLGAARALDAAGVEFVLLKGLTHEIGFGIRPENRVQYDLDLLCRPEDRQRAREALRGIGYVPHRGNSLSAEHERPLIQPFQWSWRGDYYDPEMPLPIELHDSLWNPAQDRIRIDNSGFWRRRTVLSVDGLRVPALGEADRVGFAALHVLRHVLRNDARPAHAYELARYLRAHGGQWLESRDPALRPLEMAGARFATEWFGVGGLELEFPPTLEDWFRSFAWSPIANLVESNKDAVWLHLALLEKLRDRAWVLCRRLTPLRFPHRHASFAGRLRYHAGAFAPALLNGLRWWWRRNTASTASQISD